MAYARARSKVSQQAEELIQQVQLGFPFEQLEATRLLFDVSATELAAYLRINSRTWARRKQTGRLTPEESERVYRFIRLFVMATDMLRNESKARAWLKTPKDALAGKSPLEYAETEIGAREVEDLVGRVRHGVFS